MNTTTAPIGHANHPLFTDIRNVDPGLLMLAVSMMNLDVAHTSARTQLKRDDNAVQLLGKVAPLAGKISDARNRAVESELQATGQQESSLTTLEARYVDNATVNEADNQRFKDQKTWAAERGITLEEGTKTINETVIEEVEVQVEIEVEVPIEEEKVVEEAVDEKSVGEETVDEETQPGEKTEPGEEAVTGEETKDPPTESDQALPAADEPESNSDSPKSKKDESTVEGDQTPPEATTGPPRSGEKTDVEPKTETGSTTESEGGAKPVEKKTRTVKKTVTRIEKREKTITRLVADLDAIDRNKAKLQNYRAELQAGTAFNDVLVNKFVSDPDIAAVGKTLEDLGQDISMGTLEEIRDAVRQLDSWTGNIVATIENQLVTARAVQNQMERISLQVTDQRRDIQRMNETRVELEVREQDYTKLARQFLEAQEKRTPELVDAIEKAVEATNEFVDEVREDLALRRKADKTDSP